MTHIGTIIHTFFNCKKVGQDEFNNKYFINKHKDHSGKYRRYVIYNGKIEASKVPPQWHAWLHYMSDIIPNNEKKYEWQKEHLPNLTGTKHAYSPYNNMEPEKKEKNKLTGDYEPWRP